MSKYSDKIEKLFKIVFPSYRIKKEKYIFYQNTRLFFDFYIPEMKILIEVQGQQHYSFNKLYHNNIDMLNKQKFYDSLKEEWASLNEYKLLIIKYDLVENLDEKEFKKLIINLL